MDHLGDANQCFISMTHFHVLLSGDHLLTIYLPYSKLTETQLQTSTGNEIVLALPGKRPVHIKFMMRVQDCVLVHEYFMYLLIVASSSIVSQLLLRGQPLIITVALRSPWGARHPRLSE